MQELSLRSGPSAAAAARATLATWFASRVSDPVLRDAQLIVSEVVGGAGSGEPRLQLKAGLDVEVLRVELQAPAQMSGSLRRAARIARRRAVPRRGAREPLGHRARRDDARLVRGRRARAAARPRRLRFGGGIRTRAARSLGGHALGPSTPDPALSHGCPARRARGHHRPGEPARQDRQPRRARDDRVPAAQLRDVRARGRARRRARRRAPLPAHQARQAAPEGPQRGGARGAPRAPAPRRPATRRRRPPRAAGASRRSRCR